LTQRAGTIHNPDHLGTLGGVGQFGNQDWTGGGLNCVAESNEEATCNERSIILRRSLQDDPDEKNSGTNCNWLLSSESLDQGSCDEERSKLAISYAVTNRAKPASGWVSKELPPLWENL
jgi:hypothetical protein